jgi:uncharacterized protein
MHWDFAIILLFLGGAVPWLGYRRVRRLMSTHSTTTIDRLTLYGSTIAFQWIAVAIILWRTGARGIRPAQLGLAVPDPLLAVSTSIVLSVLVLTNQTLSIRRLAAQPSEIKGVLPELALKIFPQTEIERLVFVALVTTVALCEELIYRGFVQYIFQYATHDLAVAGIVLSAAFFALAHAYQGRRGIVSTFAIGVIFAAIRWWTGSLIPSAFAHFVADLAVGLLAPKRLRAALRARSTENAALAASTLHK